MSYEYLAGPLQEQQGIGASYPTSAEDAILPFLPGDPVPNPEPEQPSLGMPDPGIYEGTGGTASLPDAPAEAKP